jgi:hypothetical protein
VKATAEGDGMPVTMSGKPKGSSSLKAEIAQAKQREVEVRSVFAKYDVDDSDTSARLSQPFGPHIACS